MRRSSNRLYTSPRKGFGADERPSYERTREPDLRRPYLAAEHHDSAHQPESRSGHRAQGGGRERPGPDRRPLRRDHDARRAGRDPGFRHLRPFPQADARDGGVARRSAALTAPARPSGAAAGGGPTRLPSLARPLSGYRGRIVQVLNNLLSNAAQHAPESSPIRVEAASADGYIAISVSDEGRGIPAERLPHLFRKRAKLSLARGDGRALTGGTGLGLVICKGLVATPAAGGRDADPGRGR